MSTPQSVTSYTLEKWSPIDLGLEDGYEEVIPAGWHHVQTLAETDIDFEAVKRLVARGGWRVVKQTVFREILYQS